MARIRTIKPEFPQSESMGQVSREARLLFVLSWTLADDSGKLRGNSRMLASLLFPYDDDAATLIDSWIAELESASCFIRYVVDGSTYIQICNWLKHQKIDKPSKSKFPEFDESSRELANALERSSGDQGPKDQRIKDQGPKDQGPTQALSASPKRERATFSKPTLEEVTAYCRERKNTVNPQAFLNHYESNGWKVGKNPMRDWRAAVRTWEGNAINAAGGAGGGAHRADNAAQPVMREFPR